MRTWLGHLQTTDRLTVFECKVSLQYEIAKEVKKLEGQKAAYFTNVEDY
ncbi:3-polyprenyl-4-hydroxybenzoate decarboxylase [Neobacillus sp. B4I6]